MMIGHYAVALAAKKLAPKTSLAVLVAAAVFLDLVWPVLLLLGIEVVAIKPGLMAFSPFDFISYPWSHSLLMALVYSMAAFAGFYLVLRRANDAFVVAALVLSHWFLDAVVHRPDLPLTPWAPTRIGFGLWNSVPGTLAVEFSMFAVGGALYLSATRARDRAGAIGVFSLALVLVLLYLGAAFGPPPPSVEAIAWSDMGQWLIIGLAWWIDAHREPVVKTATA